MRLGLDEALTQNCNRGMSAFDMNLFHYFFQFPFFSASSKEGADAEALKTRDARLLNSECTSCDAGIWVRSTGEAIEGTGAQLVKV